MVNQSPTNKGDTLNPASSYQYLLQKAMWLLTQRDHGTEELSEKIRLAVRRKGQRDQQPQEVDETLLAQVIDWCQENGLVNDHQFAEKFIRSRSRRGYGPQRIKQDLQMKGIAREIVEEVLSESDIDWYSCAMDAASKKFSGRWPTEYKEKMKAQRYLFTRGFSSSEIRFVFENFSD